MRLADTRHALILVLAVMPAAAWGLASDRDQPIHIEADSASLDENTGISVYKGNVHLSQGTLKLQGETMTVHSSGDQLSKIVLTGNPATFIQRPDDNDADLHAESGQMEYYAADERIILLKAARVWQENGKEFRSDKIIYNLSSNRINAGGSDTGDRVHIILQPKPKPQTPGEDTSQ
ncbi:MAG: lipopolysaccharide transport periplasmic protein LptA [Gammaproteobacteria bacterium]|nr:lipopolysaccharide transport periplasmic protein LptA [Gammaproteobacteria bacterium]MDH3559640.1 lipopolysaccharide transport periplasmic protein LptA [Gammaproteobacteria bacterium]